MPNTVPNQRIIHIHRERVSSDFLGIKNENWQAASRALGAHALRLYLFLAANADHYELALSPAALEAAIGMPRSTYHDQFRKLVNFGYLVDAGGNHYHFYEVPQQAATRIETLQPPNGYNFEDDTVIVQPKPQAAPQNPSGDIEINSINNIDKPINREQEKQVSPAPKINKFQF